MMFAHCLLDTYTKLSVKFALFDFLNLYVHPRVLEPFLRPFEKRY